MGSRAGDGGDGGYMSGGGGGGGINFFGDGSAGGEGGHGPVFILNAPPADFLAWLRDVAPELAQERDLVGDDPNAQVAWWAEVAAFLRETATAVPSNLVAGIILASVGL